MSRRVRADSRSARGTSSRSERISTMSAASMAMSLPLPMAQPTVAAVRAGASLMPSPTIITLRPAASSFCTWTAFSSGSTSGITSSTPTRTPMCSAAARLSPVSSTTRSPCLCRAAMAAALVSFTGSATEISPSSAPSAAKNMGVSPCPAKASAFSERAEMSTPLSSINRRLPASTVRPERTARRPRPGSSSKFSGCLPVDSFFSCAACTMAAAKGC